MTESAASSRIEPPQAPATPVPFRFPIVASVAPIILAVVLWMIIKSPYVLMFAALGPITVLASFADSRWGARRNNRRELSRFAEETDAVIAEIGRSHRDERAALDEAHPSAAAIVDRLGGDTYRWKAAVSGGVLVNIGRGCVASSLGFQTAFQGGGKASEGADRLRVLATYLEDAPVLVDAALFIGIVGPTPIAGALARSIALQLAWGLSPADHWLTVSSAEAWMKQLPHRVGSSASSSFLLQAGRLGEEASAVGVALAETEGQLPGKCRVVIRVGDGLPAAVVQHPDRTARRSFRVGLLSRESASAWASHASADAAHDGLVAPRLLLPTTVELFGLLRSADSVHYDSGSLVLPRGSAGGSLACEIAMGAHSPVTVDLVSDGPHAIIGGSTGSGKSELLVSWILAISAAYSPRTVTFLLMDFKGGSAFSSLVGLPHVVGIVTDLDEIEALRALQSIRAELKHRERVLAAVDARDIEATDSFPRLVIVVDEFAAMLADYPDLHALFSDISARGRSLGVHLILCTQRPAGAIRDSVLANADLRISLRVNNAADSAAVIGSDEAAAISPRARGQGILALAGQDAQLVQFALAGDAELPAITASWAWVPAPRRPWCERLPEVVLPASIDQPHGLAGIPFGILDLPDEQRRAVATWRPATDGHLLVLGSAGSGKSTLLRLLTDDTVPVDPPSAWDAVRELGTAHDRIISLDDVDSLLARFSPEHRDAVVQRLASALRDGPSRGLIFAMAAQRMTPEVQQLASLLPARLLLRQLNKQDFLMAGGESAHYVQKLPPGGGSWSGYRVQVARADPRPGGRVRLPEIRPLSSRPVALITSRPFLLLERMRGHRLIDLADVDPVALVSGDIVIGDIDAWQSRWGAVSALRPVADILFDRCSTSDYRTITKSRELPPPLSGPPDLCWRFELDGTASRTPLPGEAVQPVASGQDSVEF